MAKVLVGASLGFKLNLSAKPEWSQFDNVATEHVFQIEREYSNDLTDEELEQKAEELHARCQKFVEAKASQDMKNAKK